MTEDDFDVEAALADLLSGEIDIESAEGRALLDRTGMSRDEFDELQELSLAMEYRGLSEAAGSSEPAVDTTDVSSILGRLASPTDTPGPTVIRRFALPIAAAAAVLLIVLATRMGSERSPFREDDTKTLGGTNVSAEDQTFIIDLSADPPSLTIPAELLELAGGVVTVVIEEEAGEDRWSEVDELVLETTTVELNRELVFLLSDAASGSRVRWSAGSRSSDSEFFSANLELR